MPTGSATDVAFAQSMIPAPPAGGRDGRPRALRRLRCVGSGAVGQADQGGPGSRDAADDEVAAGLGLPHRDAGHDRTAGMAGMDHSGHDMGGMRFRMMTADQMTRLRQARRTPARSHSGCR